MELLLQRFSTGDESTLGIMHAIGDFDEHRRFLCFSMEDQPNEPKVPGETRIPAGRYEIKLRTEGGMNKRYKKKFGSDHFGMLWLQDVPDFEWVYIHYGNYHGDTEGCILTGDGCQSNVLEDGMVMSSIAAYTRLYDEISSSILMDFDKVWITIEDFD
jgi:hypothetical protein